MIFSFRKFKNRLKFLITLLLFAIIMYLAMGMINERIQTVPKYKQPTGSSMKVFQQEAIAEQQITLLDRLQLFYWLGE